MPDIQLFKYFESIDDPRQQGKVVHKLFDIIFLAVSAVISGCQGWEDIEDFGHDRLDWLRKYVPLEQGIPRHDTIARVMSRIDMTQFQDSFSSWMKDCSKLTQGDVVAIDGKRLKGSFNQSDRRDALYMVSAFACENGVVLAQCPVDKKSNEITALPELLELLEIKGCLVTIDAMGCQKSIAETIVDKQADYLLAVKANHKGLLSQVENALLPEVTRQASEGVLFNEADYHKNREEFRCCAVSHNVSDLSETSNWKDAKTVGVIVSYRKEKNKVSNELCYRYYISSAYLSAEELARSARQHWQIENGLHWRLDVGFKEDDCRIRREGAAPVFAGLRHIAFNQLKAETSFNKGMPAKQKKAMRSTDYLEKVLKS
ncbi:ISAs1 family transposase [Pseudoalteromonas rhizosphaerae]|jgi:predicted transposase YbfD/YdcC|nr:ISAs1 family transposase [Pseudoalteromonas rhizosphaerae]|tara:strand:- start:27 stop:1145 length:1119 start_codon:yes stop_codon:yes gene_type:complete